MIYYLSVLLTLLAKSHGLELHFGSSEVTSGTCTCAFLRVHTSKIHVLAAKTKLPGLDLRPSSWKLNPAALHLGPVS